MASQSSYRVLGVDPGTRVVGWALVEQQGRSYRLLASGSIAPAGKSRESRLAEIYAQLHEAARKHAPDAAAVEEVFAGKNLKSALAIGEGRGVALAALGAAGLEVAPYAAKVIKRAVTGNGSASKEQVARMVALQMGLAKPPAPEDVTDACAVALTHLIRRAVPA
ncbi:MAG: crossover junction endodeoxyribonuclease RuvC [Planctomycetes bacterium]|nr:crossover junction endodeoxyribonuclease RuvC [Planctomycetota bacterium]MCW8135297.1 crossover junction endodeoxyribonuclease RuvC [Planctomycetota bacterium]